MFSGGSKVILLIYVANSLGQSFRDGSDQGYFYAPISTDITWSPIQPGEISCHQRPIPEMNLANTTVVTGKKFMHTESRRAHGYLCTRSEWSVTCSEGFFGDRSVTHKIKPSLPTLAECYSAIKEYRTNHNLEKGYPSENCGWMGTNTETTLNIHVTETLVELDPYNLHLIDQRFIGGLCLTPPCTLTTMDTIWVNSTELMKSCDMLGDVTIYVPDLKDQQFFSPSLISTSLEGSCTMKICSEHGLRLSTGEWVKLDFADNSIKSWSTKYTKCPEMKEVTDVSLLGIMSHLTKLNLKEERYRLCIESKERIGSGESVSRIDLAHISPSGVSPGPVYRLRGSLIEAGMSEYKMVLSPSKHLVGAEKDILGYDISTNNTVYWEHWIENNNTIRDGPNGIVMIGNYLVNPLISLESPGKYRDLLESKFEHNLRHPALVEGVVGHLLDIVYDQKSNPKSLTKVIKTWWGSWSFTRWFWILFCTISFFCVVKLSLKIRKSRKRGSAVGLVEMRRGIEDSAQIIRPYRM